MVLPNDVALPSAQELAVPQELQVSSPALRAAAFHMGKYCDNQSKEFILCRNECEDPRKCLAEGRQVTACAIEFFRLVKKTCLPEFNQYMDCVDGGSPHLHLSKCRKTQRVFDRCMLDKNQLERPRLGYFSQPRVHHSDRPKPVNTDFPDYKAEADKMISELPPDYPIKDDYKRYYDSQTNPLI